MILAYQNREAVEFLIQNVLTAIPLPDQIREQIIEDTLKGGLAAKHAWPEKGMLEDISSAVPNISVPAVVLAGENDQVEKIESNRLYETGRFSVKVLAINCQATIS
jgi:hypothetical protein